MTTTETYEKPRVFGIVGINPKSTHGPCDEARAIEKVSFAARGNYFPLPVYFGRKRLGYAIGDRRDPRGSYFVAGTIQSTDSIIALINAGQKGTIYFSRSGVTAVSSWYDDWPTGFSSSQAGTYTGTAYTARSLTNTDVGAFSLPNVSPFTRQLTGFNLHEGGTTMLYDRVLTYESCSFNANVTQSMTNTTPAARYNGAGLSGMQIAMSVQTTVGNTGFNLNNLTYTDQSGNTGHVVNTNPTINCRQNISAVSASLPAAILAPCYNAVLTNTYSPFLPLQDGDIGARSIQNFRTSAAPTGLCCFILARPLAYAYSNNTGLGGANLMETLQQVQNLEIIYDGACLSIMTQAEGTQAFQWGTVDYVWS